MKTPMAIIRNAAYRYTYTRAPKLNLQRPVDVTLELASHCNQSCGYCYHAETVPFTKGFMTYQTAEQIIAQAHDLEVPAIKFNWKGESTLNRDFKRITQLAKDHASGYTFQERLTNSNFKFPIDRDDIFDGLCNQTKVKISFDSFIPGVMETQRAGSNFDRAKSNIDKFYNYPLRRDTEIVIQSVRTKLNANEDIASEVKRRWPSATVSIRDMVTGRVDNQQTKDLKNVDRDFTKRKSCIQAHARLVFRWDGIAFPCCVDINESMPLGNIHVTTLGKIFNSFDAQQLRQNLLNKKAFKTDGACKNCSSFESFESYKPPWGS